MLLVQGPASSEKQGSKKMNEVFLFSFQGTLCDLSYHNAEGQNIEIKEFEHQNGRGTGHSSELQRKKLETDSSHWCFLWL